MPDKIKITESQLLAFDMVLGAAIRALFNDYQKILNATDEELKKMAPDIESRYTTALNKIKSH